MKELVPNPLKQGPGRPPLAEAPDVMTVLDDSPPGEGAVDPAWCPMLEVVTGSGAPRRLRLGTEPVRLGRGSANELVLADDAVSRAHAQVRYEGGRYVLEDLGSSNGTRLDGRPVRRTAPLAPGSRIGLGKTELHFSQGAPEVSQSDRLALLQGSDLLRTLSPGTLAAAAKAARVRFAPRGEVLLRQAAPLEALLFVHRGRVRAVEVNDEGAERLVARLSGGDLFGERALAAAGPSPQTLVADTDVCLLELKKASLDELLRRSPEEHASMAGSLRSRLRQAQARAAPPGPEARRDDLDNLVTVTSAVILGEDKKLLRARERVEALVRDDGPVLIAGPNGSGRRTLSRHAHRTSPRSGQPYVEISATDEYPGGLAAAVFGLEPPPGSEGAGRAGYLEMIGEGTLAVTHAEALDAHLQVLLAGYLRLGWFHRINGRDAISARTRLVLVATGDESDVVARLAPDLREALARRTVALPPLGLRLKDIPILARHFLKLHARKAGKKAPPLSREATDRLVSYAWPGNVAELENVMQRAAIVSEEETIIPGDLIFVAPPEKDVHKKNLLRHDRIRDLLRKPWLMPAFMALNLVFVLLVLALTLYGGTRPPGHPLQKAATNPGMLLTWAVWFPLLPISALLVGRIWCGACPIAGLGDLAGKLKRFQLPVPRLLKRLDVWLVAATFVAIEYLEEVFEVEHRPLATATLLLLLIGFAVVMTVVYERKAFCRYVCPLSGLLGAYSTMSIFEVRGNKKVCQTQCGEHTCFKGRGNVPGCPLGAYPASIQSNAECMMCASCLRSCENRGVQLNLRPPLQELWRNAQPALAMSLFAVALVGLMAKHQLSDLTGWKSAVMGLGWTDLRSHNVLFLACLAAVLLPFLAAATLSAAASRETLGRNAAAYGIALVPLAFSGHIAHLVDEVLGGDLGKLLAYPLKLYDSAVNGVPVAQSTAAVGPFVAAPILTFLKLLLVLGGAAGSLVALVMIARRVSKEHVFARALPHLLLAATLFVGYLVIFTGSTADPVPATPVAAALPGAAGGAR